MTGSRRRTASRTHGTRPLALLVAAVALAVAGCGEADDTGAEVTEAAATTPTGDQVTVEVASSELGDVLVDGEGMTLYVFDTDPPGASACSDGCLDTWPPLLASEVAAGDGVSASLDTFTRDDGDQQVLVDDRPLYYYAADAEPGDTNGQGVGDVWWVVGPDGSAVTGAGDAPTGTTSPSPAATGTDEATEAAAPAAPTLAVASSEHGDIVVDAEGRSLYVFDNDDEATSACTGECLDNWPALLADGEVAAGEGVTAEVATFTREDGDTQVMLAGQPLYHFAGDEAAGDTNGQGVGDAWWLVAPDGVPVGGGMAEPAYGEPGY